MSKHTSRIQATRSPICKIGDLVYTGMKRDLRPSGGNLAHGRTQGDTSTQVPPEGCRPIEKFEAQGNQKVMQPAQEVFDDALYTSISR